MNYFADKVDYIEGKTLHWKNSLLGYIQKEKVEIPTRISKTAEEANIIVLASGNLGLIYFTEYPERLTYEQIKSAFTQLIPGMVQHDGVGFILVRSKKHGPLAIGADGIYHLAEDRVEGTNPLENFGENAARHLRRTDSFKYVPDILVNSFYEEKTGEVAAFEELIGSHGGLGGSQTQPFIMYPSDWNLEDEKIIGAERVYQVLQKKMENLWSE
jgi:putative membrane protein